MESKIFRDKSIERISSVDQLHNYMKVTSPRLWMLLSAILVLIVGFIVFASLVTIENNVKTKAEVIRYDEADAPLMEIELQIPDSVSEIVQRDMEVKIADQEGTITAVYDNAVTGKGALVTLKDPAAVLEEGTYDAQIILEAISPIRFLIY